MNRNKYTYALVAAVLVAIICKMFVFCAPIADINFAGAVCMGLLTYLAALTLYDGAVSPALAGVNLHHSGLYNKAGQAPFLLRRKQDPDNSKGMILTFANRGIPREQWEEKQSEIEAALNIHITKIADGKDRRHVLVYAVPGGQSLPEFVLWKWRYMCPEEFILALGQGLAGIIKIDLTKIPHILIGGSTGSGKSVLLKNLLMQATKKSAVVYIADFKGGLDYPRIWKRACRMVYDEETLLTVLGEIVSELQRRKALFADAECANIQEYNQRFPDRLERIVFGCDEVAELLDKTGRTKEDKERIDKITNLLSTIARQGRALGIHLILATQRPDANIIPGQIKNNLDCRICGRADLVLSQIIIDNGDANDVIPKDSQGRFLMGDGTVFQGFLFDDADWDV